MELTMNNVAVGLETQRVSKYGTAYILSLAMIVCSINPYLVTARSTHSTFLQMAGSPGEDPLASDLSEAQNDRSERLLALLSLHDSMSGLLHPDVFRPENKENILADRLGDGDIAIVDDGGSSGEVNQEELLSPTADKRVFCNGFTGCGGRFREQRRQGPPRKDKRVFCNSQGCFNGGRKRTVSRPRHKIRGQFDGTDNSSADRSAAINAANMEVWQEALKRFTNLVSTDSRDVKQKSKRLFCNGYGGCQNKGKRRENKHLRSGSIQHEIGERLPVALEIPLGDESLRQRRFFSGGFDNNMDAITSALR